MTGKHIKIIIFVNMLFFVFVSGGQHLEGLESGQKFVMHKDHIFKAVYHRKKAVSSDCVVSVLIEARHAKSKKLLWERTLDEIAGGFEDRSFDSFGFYVEEMYIELSEKKTDHLVIRIRDNSYYILDPLTGLNILGSRKAVQDIDAPASENVFEKESMRFILIQGMPGLGITISAKNKGGNAFVLSVFYTPYIVEGCSAADGKWTALSSCALGYDNIIVVKPGESFETYMEKGILDMILLSNKEAFEKSLKEYKKKFSYSLSYDTLDYSRTPAVSYSAFRLVFTAFECPGVKIEFGRIRKIYLPLSTKDIIDLVTSGEPVF